MIFQYGQNSEAAEKDMFELMNRHSLMVIATQSLNETPESAVVEFLVKHDFTINFGTLRSFRKYQNILRNPQVSLVIGGSDEVTVQYEGTAEEIDAKEVLYQQGEKLSPHIRTSFETGPIEKTDIAFFQVKPSWIRYTDVSTLPWKTFELKFD